MCNEELKLKYTIHLFMRDKRFHLSMTTIVVSGSPLHSMQMTHFIAHVSEDTPHF